MNEEAQRAVRLEEAEEIARRLKNIPTGKGKLIQIGPYGFIGHFPRLLRNLSRKVRGKAGRCPVCVREMFLNE